jgi:hypothetical protein
MTSETKAEATGTLHTPPIADFLSAARWKHALFTTYALSLSYFESEVLRPLLRAGCSNIWLIADADGYRTSLFERRSTRVGQEYRLIPVALPNGILHAKSIYLSSDDDDLLLIGSGNITFAGHGRNAEVFEAFSPEIAPTVFKEYADFLRDFEMRTDIRLGRTDWVEDFAQRATKAAARAPRRVPRATVPRLVHTLKQPICKQLPALVRQHGVCLQAFIMSPYHDADGFAVKQLLKALGDPKAAVAVTEKDSSPFPFQASKQWTRPVTAARRREPERRFVHAKWYEFEFKGARLLLTGSINATRKALTTIDNIELGVLRVMPRGRADIVPLERFPKFDPDARHPSGLGGHEIVFASFDRSRYDRLHGQLISLSDTAGQWKVRLMDADGESTAASAQLDQQGNFAIVDERIELFAQAAAIQIFLTRDGREARGWVHNEALLSIGTRGRLSPGAIARLLRREGSDDDIQALLDYLSAHAEQHLRLFSRPIVNTADNDRKDEDNRVVTVDIEDIAPIEENVGAGAKRGTVPAVSDDQFHAVMARLRRALLGHGRTRGRPGHNPDTPDPNDDGENDRRDQKHDLAETLGLRDFERAIVDMIDDANGLEQVRRGLLCLLLEVSMAMRLHRLDDKDGALEFLNDWFQQACRLGGVDQERPNALNQHVVTAATVLCALSPDAMTRASAHDSLEKFYHGPVDRRHAARSLLSDPQVGFAHDLMGLSHSKELVAALDEILATPTIRQQLEDALELAGKRLNVPADWPAFQSSLGRSLWEALHEPDWHKMVGRAARNDACAFDLYGFDSDGIATIERERIARCIHCTRLTVDLKP